MEDLKGKSVLITRGLGFVGSNLARRMIGEGADVTLLNKVREEKFLTVEDIQEEVEIVDGDVRDTELVRDFVSVSDVVYHLAAKSSRPAVNPSKIDDQIGWPTSVELEEGLKRTIDFYQSNSDKFL